MKTKIIAVLAVLTAFFALSCETPEETAAIDKTIGFTGLSADGSAEQTTSKLTLAFQKDIPSLSIADIVLSPGDTGAEKGLLSRISAGIYEVGLKNVSKTGMVTVSVSKSDWNITGSPKQASIFYKEGSIEPPEPPEPPEIPSELVAKWYLDQNRANNDAETPTYEITSGGKLFIMGLDEGKYTLTVDGNTITFYTFGTLAGTLQYAVSESQFTPSSPSNGFVPMQSSVLYKKAEIQPVNILFRELAQDGHATQTTEYLSLSFSAASESWPYWEYADIDDLSAGDITLAVGLTGAQKGALARLEQGKYRLSLSGLAKGGDIAVTVSKPGYVIENSAKTVAVFAYDEPGPEYASGDLKYTVGKLSNSVTITGYTGSGGRLTIPAYIDGRPVTAIADAHRPIPGSPGFYYGVFQWIGIDEGQGLENKITELILPNTLLYIGSHAFSKNAIAHINIPNSVEYINDYAFLNNYIESGPHTLTLSSKMTRINKYVFQENAFVSLIIPNNIVYIDAYAFASRASYFAGENINNKILSITIGENVEFYDKNVFFYMGRESYLDTDTGFVDSYLANNSAAGTYTRPDTASIEWTWTP